MMEKKPNNSFNLTPAVQVKQMLEIAMKIHTTKDGTKIKLRDMSDAHLAATIRMLERKASEGITVCIGGGWCSGESFYDEYRLKGKDALEYMEYADYVQERDRRIPNA